MPQSAFRWQRLAGATWQVTQRYVYTPYGAVTVLSPDWTTAGSQIPLTQYLHQGGRQDPVTGLYLFRHRDYSPTLGNWIEQDPAAYINGASRYAALALAPASNLDAFGTAHNKGRGGGDRHDRGFKKAHKQPMKQVRGNTNRDAVARKEARKNKGRRPHRLSVVPPVDVVAGDEAAATAGAAVGAGEAAGGMTLGDLVLDGLICVGVAL